MPFRFSLVCLLALDFVGCKDQGKLTAQKAQENAASMAKLAETDCAEIERGLPEGAKKLSALYVKGADLRQDPPAVRAALIKVRRDVPDLNIAKSTFFALADDKGVAIRNNLEQDAMAGQNLTLVFPELAKVGSSPYVVTTGAFAGTGTPAVPDKDWIAAVPVKIEGDKVAGIFVTGWSFRRFAFHLQESLKHDLAEQLLKDHDTGKLPILYVMVFDKSGVYGAPQTPGVNEKALSEADLVGKTSAGATHGVLTITDREFGYGAARVPKLGAETGVVVLRSDL
jgi:hypothetical protein